MQPIGESRAGGWGTFQRATRVICDTIFFLAVRSWVFGDWILRGFSRCLYAESPLRFPRAKLQSQSQLVTSASSATYLMIANAFLTFNFSAYHIDISVLFYIFCPDLPFASYARYSSNKARRAGQRNPMTVGNLQCSGRPKHCSRQQSLMMFMTGFP